MRCGLFSTHPVTSLETERKKYELTGDQGDQVSPEHTRSRRVAIRSTAGLLPDNWPWEGKPHVTLGDLTEKTAPSLSIDNGLLTSPTHATKVATELTEATERVQLRNSFLSVEQECKVRDELFSCLQCKFEEAYNLALEQAKQHQRNARDSHNSELLIAYRREQQAKHQEKLEEIKEKLEAEFREEQKEHRRRAYQRRVKVLLAQQSEKKTEYQNALEQYYTYREGGQPASGTFSTRDGSFQIRFTCEEEIALRTSAESMSKDQVMCLRIALHRLKKRVKMTEEHTQRCLSQRQNSVFAAKNRAQQQYLSIIAEQQNELRMLQHWYSEMQKLELEAKEIMRSYTEQRIRRQQHMQREKEGHVPSVTISNGEEGTGKGGSVLNAKSFNGFQRGLFDFLL
ncbi:hypothetical protein MOQ_000494 [Trypanosoma cruzi marinkellei]|uniref:Uncharacterized protein n=1 Tax=Trypanosoma cruzi marinkellei TaxID=85056 RepID=K2PEA3_TRYCR|nr:hypothetical protein MOQ_000494 [Trypanosoma cruzi marinkellei]